MINTLLFLVLVLYTGSITSNLMNIYMNYQKAQDFTKFMIEKEEEIRERKKLLEEEINRFNDHVMKMNMEQFTIEQADEGVKH